jgi:hypothetical protein
MRSLTLAALVTAALLAVAPGHARAASQRTLGLDELITAASEIVVGEVVASEARFEGRLVVTRSTVQVEESLKGAPGARLEVTQLGGTAVHPVIGVSITMDVSSYTAFRPGEKVVLFVEPRRPRGRQLVGGEQGKLLIREEAATGTRKLPVGPKRLHLVREPERDVVAPEAMTLDDLRVRVREALARPTGATR